MAFVVGPGKAMCPRKAIEGLQALLRGPRACASGPFPREALFCALLLSVLSACGSVQTTSQGGVSSIAESVSDPQPPVVTGVPLTSAQVGVLYDYTPGVSDPLSSALTFDITNMPSWATFDTATGELKGTPTTADVGTTNEIEIGVSDGVGSATVGPFRITIAAAQSSTPPTTPPTISGTPPVSVIAGQAYFFAPSASDVNGGALTFAIINRPAWASFSTSTGQLSGTPTAADVGSYASITISVSDGTLATALPAFTVTVLTPSITGPPTISGNPTAWVNAGSVYSFTPSASDPNGSPLSFSIQNLPAWAIFNTNTGQLSGSPSLADIGTYRDVVISVSDGTLTASLAAFTLTVTAPGEDPPTIAGSPATSVYAGSGYSFTPSASDPAGNPLTFSIQNMPSWANFNANTGQLSGTPGSANVGSYPNIVISVSDGTLAASLPAFRLTVTAPGAPTIGGTPATSVYAGSLYSFTPSADDAAGNPLTFSIQNLPAWAAFNPETGRLSGTPTTANLGSYPNIVISVSDGTLTASLAAFSITVSTAPVDGPPTISGNPATSASVGSAYSFTPSATDPEGHALTFSIQNLPAWMTFSATTGRLSGTPSAANIGDFPNISISVTNGTATASLPAFTLTVTASVDGAPTISGNPANSVVAGSTYSFTPNASDPQGHALIFSIQNQPAWASFNANTGQLSGTPAAADVGNYTDITISVSNGTRTASLPAFSITVTQLTTATVTVSWNIPTQNTNGTPLTNLAGFRVYFGTDPNNLTQSEQIANPGVTSYVLTNLAPGTWYIGLVDYTTAGVASSFSNIASTTVQ